MNDKLFSLSDIKMTAPTQEEIDQRLRDFQRDYIDFLDDADRHGVYSNLVR